MNHRLLLLVACTALFMGAPSAMAEREESNSPPNDPGRISCIWDFDWKRHEGKDPYAGLKRRNRREVERGAKTLERYGVSGSGRRSMVEAYNSALEKICDKRILMWQESNRFGTAVQNADGVRQCTDYEKWGGYITKIKDYNNSLNDALKEESEKLKNLYNEKSNAELKEIAARQKQIDMHTINRNFIGAWGRPVYTSKAATKETAWEGFFSRRILQMENELKNSSQRESYFNAQEKSFQINRKKCGDIIRRGDS